MTREYSQRIPSAGYLTMATTLLAHDPSRADRTTGSRDPDTYLFRAPRRCSPGPGRVDLEALPAFSDVHRNPHPITAHQHGNGTSNGLACPPPIRAESPPPAGGHNLVSITGGFRQDLQQCSSGHVPGAAHMPESVLARTFASGRAQLGGVSADKTLTVVCRTNPLDVQPLSGSPSGNVTSEHAGVHHGFGVQDYSFPVVPHVRGEHRSMDTSGRPSRSSANHSVIPSARSTTPAA